LKKKGNGRDEKTKSKRKKHIARVTLPESFDLGKNTGRKAGITIEISDKYGRLGKIQIGQGWFKWWAAWAKARTVKGGKRPTTVSLSWSEFADLMAKKIEEDRK
jgi:hypothetical protein